MRLIMELKNSEMKNSLQGVNSRSAQAKERLSKCENLHFRATESM